MNFKRTMNCIPLYDDFYTYDNAITSKQVHVDKV